MEHSRVLHNGIELHFPDRLYRILSSQQFTLDTGTYQVIGVAEREHGKFQTRTITRAIPGPDGSANIISTEDIRIICELVAHPKPLQMELFPPSPRYIHLWASEIAGMVSRQQQLAALCVSAA